MCLLWNWFLVKYLFRLFVFVLFFFIVVILVDDKSNVNVFVNIYFLNFIISFF